MKLLDGRHRWGEPIRNGANVTRTCRSCGRSVTFETLIPDSVVDALVRSLISPNPYRALSR